jgi:hypothetical protein
MTARRFAPARTSGERFAAVIPPMAQQGHALTADHDHRISGSASAVTGFEVELCASRPDIVVGVLETELDRGDVAAVERPAEQVRNSGGRTSRG